MSDSTCRGCGASGGDCAKCSATTNWHISCGCDHCGDHLACTKECERYGCCHPRGLSLSGTLDESERWSGESPPRHIVARAIDERTAEVEKKHRKALLKLEKQRLSLDEYEEAPA